MQERDGEDQLPASNVFIERGDRKLDAQPDTLEGKTERQKNLHPVARLAPRFRAGGPSAWIIARLGG